MTTGVGWVEDYHDPDSAASRMIGALARGPRRDPRAARRASRPATRPARATRTAAPTRWCSTGSANGDRSDVRRGLGRGVAVVGAEHPAVVGLDGPAEAGASPWPRRALAVTARDWARIGWLQVDGTLGRRPRWSTPSWVEASSRPERPFLATRPTAQHDHHACRLRLPLVAAGPTTATRVMADGMRGQFVLRRPAAPYGRREDLGVALRRRLVGPPVPRPVLPGPAGDRRGGSLAA